MIANLKPYQDYRDSGLSWLGPVPRHWEIARSKRLFTPRKQLALPDDEQLSATQAFGVIPQALYEQRTGYRVVKISMHLDRRRHVEAGDFVISMRSFQGGLERAWSSGAIRSSYVVLRPTPPVCTGYFQYLFKSMPYISALGATADFIRDGQDLNFDNFCGVPLPIIPKAEQESIARFMDWANGRLERAIRAKRKVIALLNEQKQAIIYRAVTRGLNPSVPLKPSGVPWLGDIPKHWETAPNRSYLKLQRRLVGKRSREFVLLSLTLRGVVARDVDNPVGKWPASFDTYQQVDPGDLVFCLFDIDETPRFVGLSALRGMITGAYTVFACKNAEVGEWAHQFYMAMDFDKRLKPAYTGLRKVIQKGTFLGLKTPLPPPEERRAILANIASSTGGIVAGISRLEREIELLREYRGRLVADVVTGKLDVREAAARLPREEPVGPLEGNSELVDELEAADEDPAV